jgi:hypothetical protein
MSIKSAALELKKIYKRKYDEILDIIEVEFDENEINEILKNLAEPSQNSFISEIKEKIILNAQ